MLVYTVESTYLYRRNFNLFNKKVKITASSKDIKKNINYLAGELFIERLVNNS